MKEILFVGNTDKSMLLLGFANTLADISNTTLIIDLTTKQDYLIGYFDSFKEERFSEGTEYLDCVRANDYQEAIATLKKHGQELANYDFVLIDVDNPAVLQSLNKGIITYYVGDEDNRNIHLDCELLHKYCDLNDVSTINHIHFSSQYRLNPAYIKVKMKERIEWSSFNLLIEFDDAFSKLQLLAQHENKMKVKQFSKSFREVLLNIIFDVNDQLPIKEIASSLKISPRKINLVKEYYEESFADD